jgi:hypothetical protein
MTDDRDDSFSILTPVSRRRIESSAEMLEAPAERIAFQHTVLCQTALPYRDPGDDVREWERQQGAVSLQVYAGVAHNPATRRFVKLGLPYGSRPRLILTHLNSEALRTRSPRIDVERSLTAFTRRIQDRPPTGPEVRGSRTSWRGSRQPGCIWRLVSPMSGRSRLIQKSSMPLSSGWTQGTAYGCSGRRLSNSPHDISTVWPAMQCLWMSGPLQRSQIRRLPSMCMPGWHSGCTGSPRDDRSG